MLLARDRIYPMEIHWGAKSESVRRILASWNIGAGDVVMVDDSSMELAEVQRAHPAIECLAFRQEDPASIWELLAKLRDLFGKECVSTEDRIRLDSLRAAATQPDAGVAATPDEFLAQANAVVTLDFRTDLDDQRASTHQ
jgi:predicted enzyme involved in methoxymalonyl-ACP biosynthesis